ncbi:hypothetical protein Tco_0294169 [Tanacetum coccineum]
MYIMMSRPRIRVSVQAPFGGVTGSLRSKIVYDEDVELMIMNVSDVEIKEALFDICDNKALGPDGYSAKFFKSAWYVIKNEVRYAIKELFRIGKMLGESVKVVKRALDMFSSISSLNLNIGKSTIFFGNVKEQDKTDILATLPFKIGSLPVSYLGVPLITKHLTFTDCKGLIDKLKIKVNDWRNKLLSYAGRLQLIASILSSIQVY